MIAPGTALQGHLHLVCERDSAGRTFLAGQSFRAPMHLSKPHWDGACLIINAVNPTAGLFSGDSADVSVHVGEGACALFTSPSASRIHRARDGEAPAGVRQRYSVGTGGWLDVHPEMLIAQAGSRYEQETHIEVAARAGLLSIDCLAPGRAASGEIFAFEHIRCRTRLVVEEELLLVENYRLSPHDDSLRPLRTHHPHSYCAALIAVFPTPGSMTPLLESIAGLSGERVAAGASALGSRALAGKVLAADSPSMRRAILEIRSLCYSRAGRPLPLQRKL